MNGETIKLNIKMSVDRTGEMAVTLLSLVF